MDKSLILKLLKAIMKKEYSVTASAAILGNWIAEGCLNNANVNLDRITNGYHEVGALGFTGGTASSYLTHCRMLGKKWNDLENQVEFALDTYVVEYYPEFERMGLWKYFKETGKYLNCFINLENFKNADIDFLETATISFMLIWWSPTYNQIQTVKRWANRDTGKYELTFAERLSQEIRDRTKYANDVLKIYKEEFCMENYIQSDQRWANKPYAGETMAVAGCGPTSVADVISLVCNKTPAEVADYITSIGGASNGYGTYWEAIPCACNHFGMECIQLNTSSVYGEVDSEAEKKFLALMKTGEYVGILLMGNGFFCVNGHYIAVVYIDGELYILVYDVAYSPRSVLVKWSDIAPANKDGNAVKRDVPFFRGKVKVFYAIKKKKSDTPIKNKTSPTSYLTTFRQIKQGDKGMTEIYIWEEFMIAEGLYDGKLDFDFGPKLTKATEAWQKKNKDWITGKPLVVDCIVGPNSWRSAMHMKGSLNGNKISFILREKFPGENGATCRFTQKVEKARGMYDIAIDDDNGPKNQAGNIAYKKARGFKEQSGKITYDMLKDMCGGL